MLGLLDVNRQAYDLSAGVSPPTKSQLALRKSEIAAPQPPALAKNAGTAVLVQVLVHCDLQQRSTLLSVWCLQDASLKTPAHEHILLYILASFFRSRHKRI